MGTDMWSEQVQQVQRDLVEIAYIHRYEHDEREKERRLAALDVPRYEPHQIEFWQRLYDYRAQSNARLVSTIGRRLWSPPSQTFKLGELYWCQVYLHGSVNLYLGNLSGTGSDPDNIRLLRLEDPQQSVDFLRWCASKSKEPFETCGGSYRVCYPREKRQNMTFRNGDGRVLGSMTSSDLRLLCANLRAALVVVHDNPKLEPPEESP